MDAFSSFSAHVTKITITPVTNGWVVMVPTESSSMKSQFADIMSSMQKAIQENGMDDIEKLISKAVENSSEEVISRDESLHVFTRFKDVLHFLSERIKE